MKRKELEGRIIREAEYMIETRCTIRQIASKFMISKSTVHKDIAERLCQINIGLYEQCRSILDHNKSVRHLRGGQATARKFKRA